MAGLTPTSQALALAAALPSGLYVGLLESAPTTLVPAGVEASPSGYARIEVTTWTDVTLEGSGDIVRCNADAITFGSYGEAFEAVAFALYDASSGGTMRAWIPIVNADGSRIVAPIEVGASDSIRLSAGDLCIGVGMDLPIEITNIEGEAAMQLAYFGNFRAWPAQTLTLSDGSEILTTDGDDETFVKSGTANLSGLAVVQAADGGIRFTYNTNNPSGLAAVLSRALEDLDASIDFTKRIRVMWAYTHNADANYENSGMRITPEIVGGDALVFASSTEHRVGHFIGNGNQRSYIEIGPTAGVQVGARTGFTELTQILGFEITNGVVRALVADYDTADDPPEDFSGGAMLGAYAIPGLAGGGLSPTLGEAFLQMGGYPGNGSGNYVATFHWLQIWVGD